MKERREIPRFNKGGSRSKVDSVQYRCAPCGQWTPSKSVAVDHISPVIDVQTGFVDWNQFVTRLFCGPENLQVICDTCHDAKTQVERITRLIKQYTQELDKIQFDMSATAAHGSIPDHVVAANYKDWKKALSKYIAKKKTPGLEKIVERARDMKEQLK